MEHFTFAKQDDALEGICRKKNIDFNPDTLYAPVASHETIRIILAFAASSDFILEGGDVANAYLYGKNGCPGLHAAADGLFRTRSSTGM